MILLARRRGTSPVRRPLSRFAVYLSLLSVLWIGGRASAQTPSAQPPAPQPPSTQPSTQTPSTQPPSTQAPPTEAPAQEPQEQEEPAPSGSAAVDAARALREGRYDRVEQIAARAGAVGTSPLLDALRGRAFAARGRYDDA